MWLDAKSGRSELAAGETGRMGRRERPELLPRLDRRAGAAFGAIVIEPMARLAAEERVELEVEKAGRGSQEGWERALLAEFLGLDSLFPEPCVCPKAASAIGACREKAGEQLR